jgi:hypothetical protein
MKHDVPPARPEYIQFLSLFAPGITRLALNAPSSKQVKASSTKKRRRLVKSRQDKRKLEVTCG